MSHLPAPVATCLERLATALDARSAARLPVLLLGLLLAKGRRTCTAWFREFRRAYHVGDACGRRVEPMDVPGDLATWRRGGAICGTLFPS